MHCQPIHNGKTTLTSTTGVAIQGYSRFLFPQTDSGSSSIHPQIFLILPCKDSFCLVAGKAALAGWLAGKIILTPFRYFSAKPCFGQGKNRTGHVRNRNTALQGAGHVKFNPSRIMKRYQSWKGFPEYVPESGCAYTGREEQADRSIPPFGNNPVINATTL